MDFQKNIDQYLLQTWPVKGWTAEEIKTVCKELDTTFIEILTVLNTPLNKKQGRKPYKVGP